MDVPMPEAAPWDALMDQAASGNVQEMMRIFLL